MKRLIFLLTVSAFLFTNNCMAQFTTQEATLIRSGNEEKPMRVLKIKNQEDSVILRTECQDIDLSNGLTEDISLLIERMITTMDFADGVGIAAPQVGLTRNLFIFTRTDDEEWPAVAAINPKIVAHPDTTICFEGDGCLSIPGVGGNTIRYPWIEVEYTNQFGELVRERLEGYDRETGFTAIVFQHEFDHLKGVLFTDKLCPEQSETTTKRE